MRRTVFAALLLAAAAAYAIDTRSHSTRIGLLSVPDQWADRRDSRTADLVRSQIRSELRELGYDAFLTGDRFTDLPRDVHPTADYYVDVIGAGSDRYPVAGIGIPVGRAA